MHQTPEDDVLWLAVADCLEENGEAERAELLRLNRRMRGFPETDERWAMEDRVRELLNGGVRPCVPAIVNSIGMRFAMIPPGTFWMGSPEDEEGRQDNEVRHEVTLTRPFWMGVSPVTQAQYEKVMGKNPSYFSKKGGGKGKVRKVDTGSFPVEQVSWEDAAEFCEKLSMMSEEKKERHLYRLPTEAEWEYSCRGGLVFKPFHFGDELNGTQANCDGNFRYGTDEKGPYLERTCATSSYPPNAFGLHDMHGNVWEWCHDWYGEYSVGPAADPTGPERGPYRVFRGGAWGVVPDVCRTAIRSGDVPAVRRNFLGFRVALASAPR